MRFSSLKEFRGRVTDEVTEYLRVDMTKILRELKVGLSRLSFGENFEGFEATVTIASGAEAEIRNELGPAIPTKRIIVRGKDGAEDIVDGDTDWTANFVYLKNVGASSATVTVLFLK